MRAMVLALAAVFSVLSVSSAQTVKLGYVNVDLLLHNYSDFRSAQTTLQTEVQKWQQELETYQKQIAAMQDNFRQKATASTPDQQRGMQAELLKKTQEAQQYQQDIFGPEGRAEKRKNELMGPINDKVNQAIQQVGARDNYSLIVKAEALLYAGSGTDVTDAVQQVLKAGGSTTPAAAGAAKTSAPAGPRR